LSYAVGAAAATAALILNLLVVRELLVAPAALPYWLLRVGVDAIQGAAAGGIASLEFKGVHDYAGWALAGLCAPPLTRKLRFGKPGSDDVSFELQDFVDRLTSSLDERLQRTSDQLKAHINRRLVARLTRNRVSPSWLAEELLAVIRARHKLENRLSDARYIRNVVASKDPDPQKLRLLVERARALKILRTPRYLGRSWRAPEPPAPGAMPQRRASQTT
jgi:hypothetical protein